MLQPAWTKLGEAERSLAEGEGFEPPIPFRVQRFSRPPPSTTRPSLRRDFADCIGSRGWAGRARQDGRLRPVSCRNYSNRPRVARCAGVLAWCAGIAALARLLQDLSEGATSAHTAPTKEPRA